MKVTAAVLEQIGSEFTLKTLDLADPGPGEVLIEVAGVGVCHTDLAVQHGHLPFPFPAVLGHEEMQARGLSLKGIVESDSNPDVFIPRLIEMYQAGAFPFDKIITMIPFAKINDAVAAQARGEAVKVVLVHS